MVVGKDNAVYLRYYRQFRRLCLLDMYDELRKSEAPQIRGYRLEDLLNQTFNLYRISAIPSFKRNEGAEQIDGGFSFEGKYYLVECRWRKEPADREQVDEFYTKVERSGGQPMGLFLSINGWSDNVEPLLKQNPRKCIVLMDGNDLQSVLRGMVGLQELIKAKYQHLTFESEPFYGVEEYLKDYHKV